MTSSGRSDGTTGGGAAGRDPASRGSRVRPPRHHHDHRHHERHPRSISFSSLGRAQRGNVRTAILALLTEEPMHGYQIMQRLEERSGGAWRPSAGSIYPTLQLLEEEGLIKGEEAGGRRVFSLTAAGAAEAPRSKDAADDTWRALNDAADTPRHRLHRSISSLRGAARQVTSVGTDAQVEEALRILNEARKRIYGLLADDD